MNGGERDSEATGRGSSLGIRVYAALLLAIALVLLGGGAYLLTLGGSPYYALIGLCLLVAAIALWRHRSLGAWLYGAAMAVTAGWAVWEAGLDGWALMPRILAPFVFGLPLLLPAFRRRLTGPVPVARLGGVTGFLIGTIAASAIGYGLHLATPQPIDPIYQAGIGKFDGKLQPVADLGDVDWTQYAGNHSSRFSTLDQITPANLDRLKIAWTYRVGMPRDSKLQTLPVTPLKIADTLYLCTPDNIVVALDAETGKQLWRHDSKADSSGLSSTATCRGVSYYKVPDAQGVCAERIFTNTIDARLIALDAATGQLCPSFGEGGQVSLLKGMGNVTKGYYYVSSPPAVVRGKLVLGGWVSDNQFWGEPSGVIRAYDAVTGKLAWAFDMGRPDKKDEPVGDDHYTRSTPNSWAPMSADEQLGLVYAPTGNATPDNYGGERRPFDDKYSSSVVAIDAETGNVRWSFQTTHHDLWDYDVPSQPTLADIGGRKLLVQGTKRGELFVLDRTNGQPVAKVEERKVPQQGKVPGERLSPTQPFSAGVPSLSGPELSEKLMWGITPLDQLWCRVTFRESRFSGPMTPPTLNRFTIVNPGYGGGSNWGSVAIDPKRGVMVANAIYIANRIKLIRRKDADAMGLHPLTVDTGAHGVGGPAAQANTPYAVVTYPFISPLNVPCQQPPYGTISGIDMRSHKLLWTQRFGTARDSGPLNIPSHLPLTMGVPANGGALSTGSGITFIGASQDRYFRAYETTTGRILWQDRLPAGGQATPMTYRSGKSGRQFVVIAAGGSYIINSKLGDYIIAYALPK